MTRLSICVVLALACLVTASGMLAQTHGRNPNKSRKPPSMTNRVERIAVTNAAGKVVRSGRRSARRGTNSN